MGMGIMPSPKFFFVFLFHTVHDLLMGHTDLFMLYLNIPAEIDNSEETKSYRNE